MTVAVRTRCRINRTPPCASGSRSTRSLSIASHGTTPDGYLFQGRMHKLVIRRTYQEDFDLSAARAGLPPEFI